MNQTDLWKQVQPTITLIEDVRKSLRITNVKLESTKKDYGEGEVDTLRFSSTVTMEDGKPVEKAFNTTSKPFLKEFKRVFEKEIPQLIQYPETFINLSIKKKGSGNKTTYDIERVVPQ